MFVWKCDLDYKPCDLEIKGQKGIFDLYEPNRG